jgi:hypothetical protein
MNMTKTVLVVVLSGIALILPAQKMTKINLEELGLKYMVPKG